jgi:hypothetical protein
MVKYIKVKVSISKQYKNFFIFFFLILLKNIFEHVKYTHFAIVVLFSVYGSILFTEKLK